MKVFIDTEFTGLFKNSQLISIGCVDENGYNFYAVLNDFDLRQVDEWIQKNVIDHLYDLPPTIIGNKKGVTSALEEWLKARSTESEQIEIWSDTLAYDWVHFCDLWENARNLPNYIYYIPFDLATLFKIKNIDPDINRVKFSGFNGNTLIHNALSDAQIIRECYNKLMEI